MAKKKKSKAGVVTIDFSNVEEGGGGRPHIPEDDYKVKVKSVKHETSEKGNPMLVWEFLFVDYKKGDKILRDYTVLKENSLWKIRDLLEAAGVKVPKSSVDIPLKKLVGRELGVTVEDEEYENKMQSRITDYVSLKDLKSGGVDDDEDEEDEDLDEMDRAELKAYIKENDLDVKVTKKMDEDDIREAIQEEEDDDSDDDDEDDDEDDDDDLDELDLDEL